MGGVAAGVLAAIGVPAGPGLAADPVAKTTLTSDQALRLLKEGNDQFRMDAPYRAAQGRERRIELARGQAPFCGTCSSPVSVGPVRRHRQSP